MRLRQVGLLPKSVGIGVLYYYVVALVYKSSFIQLISPQNPAQYGDIPKVIAWLGIGISP